MKHLVAACAAVVLIALGAILLRPRGGNPPPADPVAEEPVSAPAGQPTVNAVRVPVAPTPQPGGGDLAPFPVELDQDTSIAGRIVDTAGHPLAATAVTVQLGRGGVATLPTGRGEYERYAQWTAPGVETDRDGRFAIAGLDPRGRSHYLRITAPEGYIADLVRIGRLRKGELTDLGDIVLFRPARVSGTVTNSVGRPVAGAMVRVGRPRSRRGARRGEVPMMVRRANLIVAELSRPADEQQSDGQPIAASTQLRLGPGVSRSDTRGHFELEDVDPGSYVISCRHTGYLDALREDVRVAEGQDVGPVGLVLQPAFCLTVAVADADGNAIAGAEVSVCEEPERNDWLSGTTDWESSSDALGEVRFATLRTARVGVRASAEGHREARQEMTLEHGSVARLEVVLQPGGEMRGQLVTADGTPPRHDSNLDLFVTRSALEGVGGTMVVDEDGRFVDRGLPPGPYTISIMGARYRDLELGPRELLPGGTLDWGTIEVSTGVSIEVHVADAHGTPVEDAWVSSGGFSDRSITDAQGNATLHISPGTVRLRAGHPGYADGWADPIEVDERVDRLQVEITLGRGGKVIGCAFAADGSILAAATVDLHTVDGGAGSRAVTDPRGRFRFEGVSPGQYRLRLEGISPGPNRLEIARRPRTFTASEVFAVREGQTVEQNAHQPEQQRLDGIVLDSGDNPVSGCAITTGVMRPGADGGWTIPHPMHELRTDADGRFAIYDIRSPAIQVVTQTGQRHVFGLGGISKEVTLRIPSQSESRGNVTGMIHDVSSSRALGGADVAISTADADGVTLHRRVQRRSGADGRYVLSVPPGSYRLQVSRGGHSTEARTVEILGDRTVTVDVALYEAGHLDFVVASQASRTMAPVTITARLPGDPNSLRTENGMFGRPISLHALRLGDTYDVSVTAHNHREFKGSYRVVAGDREPVRIVLQQ